MSKRLNWDRAKPYRQTESKVAPGTTLPNGARVPFLPQDDLARRADREMQRWLNTLRPRDRRRFAP